MHEGVLDDFLREEAKKEAAEIDRLRHGLSWLIRHTPGHYLRSLGFYMQDTASVEEFLQILKNKTD